MNIEGIISSIEIFVCYFLLIVVLSSFILKSRIKDDNIFKRFMIYIVFGNFYISSIVFILCYLKIFNRSILILSIFVISIFLRIVINKKLYKTQSRSIKDMLINLLLGRYGFKLFSRDLILRLKTSIRKFFSELVYGRRIEWILFIIIIFYNVYQYGANPLEFTTYMAPDEEVHLYWIQSLIKGKIYPSGVYPHVFHTVLSAIIILFKLNATVVIQYASITFSMLIMTMLYLGLRKLFKYKYPALLGLMIYSTANFYIEQATNRFQFTIPQEYGMIMLIPIAVFLFDYLRDKKIKDLIFFGLALSLSVSIHFYTGIIGIILMMVIAFVYIVRIIREKLLGKLIICGLLSAFLAVGPLAIGVILGHPLEQSMDWALEVFRGDIYKDNNVSSIVLEDKENNDEDSKDNDNKDREDLTWNKFKRDATLDLVKYGVTDIRIMYWLTSIILLTIAYNLYRVIIRKAQDRNLHLLAFSLNSLLLLFIMTTKSLNLPTIMEPKRVMIFFAYFSSIFLGIPLELLIEIFKRQSKKFIDIMSIVVILLVLFIIINTGYLRPLSAFYYFQTSGTMKTNLSIMNDYEDFTWTVVSPVNNISSILNNGFHYELSEFITSQENWNNLKETRIPTEYVFIYIEKKPIVNYGDRFHRDDKEIINRDDIKVEDALNKLSAISKDNFIYKRERKVLMAKAYMWAKEYQKYFPEEMNVYYEDSELIVYRIHQNVYALNNFNIDYKFNRK